jgi:predicted amidohydrolase YtcJ
LLRNTRLPGDSAQFDVLLTDGVVAAVSPAGSGLPDGRSMAARPLDLDGRHLLPGLWDEHVHFTQWALTRRRLDVSAASSAAAAADLVRQRVNGTGRPADGPLVGYGFRDGLWPDEPSARLLDEAGHGAAVVLISADLHCLWLSTAAGEHYGVTIDATGLLREDAAFEVNGRLTEVPDAVLDAWAGDAAAAAAGRGVVGIVDLEMAWNAGVWARRVDRGIGPLRVETGVYAEHLDRAIAAGLRTGTPVDGGDGMVVAGPFKVLIDGSLNTRTAYCFDPYPGGSHGMLTVQPEDLLALMRRATDAGITCAVHAIGDRANSVALDAVHALQRPGRIEHAQLVAPADFARFAELGVAASVQPAHATADRDVADRHWHGRTGGAFALRSLLDHGATLAFGSDAPVSPLDPWLGIAAAVDRTDNDLPPWHPEQRLAVPEALRASSRGRSTVEVGQRADLIAVEQDPLICSAAQLRSMPVGLTLVGGAVAFSTVG